MSRVSVCHAKTAARRVLPESLGRLCGAACGIALICTTSWALAQASPIGGGPGPSTVGNPTAPTAPVLNGPLGNPTPVPGNAPLQDPNAPARLSPPAALNPNVGGSISSPIAVPSPRSGPIGPTALPNSVDSNTPPSLPPSADKTPPKPAENLDAGIPANKFGHLGITVLPVDNDDGLEVVGIERTSPAYPAGLIIGDQITAINGQRITKFEDLVKGLHVAAEGDGMVNLLVRRRGTLDTINVMVGGKKALVEQPKLGVMLDDSNGRLRVTEITPNGPAAVAGMQIGDEIVLVNDYPVSTYDLFVGQIQAMGRAGGQVPLGVRRKGKMLILHATIGTGKAPPLPKGELPPVGGPTDIK